MPRLALIGAGRWGQKIRATLATLPCELAHEATHEWRMLLENDDIDGVIIATPPSTHAEIALAFIEKGIPVFIEKPMTLSFEEANALVAASEKTGVPVMVGHVHLYNPAFRALKDALPSIGTLISLQGTESHEGPVRTDYSTLWDSAPHDLSMMLDIAGFPLEVRAEGEALSRPESTIYDRGLLELMFNHDVHGTIRSDWIGPEKKRIFQVIGTEGSLTYDDVAKTLTRITKEGSSESLPFATEWPLTLELRAFLETVEYRTRPYSDVTLGRDIVQILGAAEHSIIESRGLRL